MCRAADKRNLPPSRLLGTGLPEWGDTDALIMVALDLMDEAMCRCGCGQVAAEAHDPDVVWHVRTDLRCYAGGALREWQDEQRNREDGGDKETLPYLVRAETVTVESRAAELAEWREQRRRNRERRKPRVDAVK